MKINGADVTISDAAAIASKADLPPEKAALMERKISIKYIQSEFIKRKKKVFIVYLRPYINISLYTIHIYIVSIY